MPCVLVKVLDDVLVGLCVRVDTLVIYANFLCAF